MPEFWRSESSSSLLWIHVLHKINDMFRYWHFVFFFFFFNWNTNGISLCFKAPVRFGFFWLCSIIPLLPRPIINCRHISSIKKYSGARFCTWDTQGQWGVLGPGIWVTGGEFCEPPGAPEPRSQNPHCPCVLMSRFQNKARITIFSIDRFHVTSPLSKIQN